jgi:hypothetical protein
MIRNGLPGNLKYGNLNYSNNSYIYPTKAALRKYTSIVLLLILLFNMVGYRALFYYAERKADAAMESRLDKDQYDENELVSLTIPLHNPYQLEQKSFERVNGEISFQGKTYKFVKRMVSGGNLVLLCMPDVRKMVLKKAKADYGNAANGLTNNGKSSSRSGTQKNFSGGDYIDQFTNFEILKFENEAVAYHIFSLVSFSDPHIAAPGQPPQYRA